MSNKLPKFSDWSRYFERHILARGRDYWESGSVASLSFDSVKACVTAKVQGSSDYLVSIFFPNNVVNGQLQMQCSCPYAKDGNHCKHMAAVLFEIDGELDNCIEGTSTTNLYDQIADIVNNLPIDNLRVLLTDAAMKDPLLRDTLLLQSGAPISKELPLKWTEEVIHIIDNTMSTYKYDDLAFYLTNEIRLFFSEKINLLDRYGAKQSAFELLCTVYDRIASIEKFEYVDYDDYYDHMYDDDDYDWDFDDIFGLCTEYWSTLLQGSSLKLRKAVFPWFEAKAGLPSYSIAFDFMIHEFSDKELSERKLVLIDRLIDAISPDSDGDIEDLIEKRISVMLDLGFSQTQLSEFRKQYHRFPGIRKQEIDAAILVNDYGTIEDLLRESIILDKDSIQLVDGYHRQLITLFEETGQSEKYRLALSEYVFNFRQTDLFYILKLKEITSEQDWIKIRETFMADSKYYLIRYDLMESEELYERLFLAVTDPYAIWELPKYEETLKQHFPIELRDVLLARADHEMRMASKRSAYEHIIADMKRIATYPDGAIELKAMVQRWKEQYRRPAMLEELKKAGF